MKWKFKYINKCNAVVAECEGRFTSEFIQQFRIEGLNKLREYNTNRAIIDYRNVDYLLTPSDILNTPTDIKQSGGESVYYALVMGKESPTYNN
jgi:hypothetical protein